MNENEQSSEGLGFFLFVPIGEGPFIILKIMIIIISSPLFQKGVTQFLETLEDVHSDV